MVNKVSEFAEEEAKSMPETAACNKVIRSIHTRMIRLVDALVVIMLDDQIAYTVRGQRSTGIWDWTWLISSARVLWM
jgi:hypothetical protein